MEILPAMLASMLHKVAVIALDRVAPFELGVACEVFGTNRAADGFPVYDFALCTADGRPVRTSSGFEVVALFRKPDAIKVPVPTKYVGFDIPNEFVVGYGLDFAERYREVPYVGVLKPEVYARS